MDPDEPRTPYFPGFWLAAFILAWAVDLLFWKQAAGVNFAVWVCLGVAGLFAAAWWERRRPALPSYLLAAIAVIFSLAVFLRSEPFSAGISALLAVAALGLLAATFTSGNWVFYRIGDFCLAGLKLIAAGIVRGGKALAHRPSPVDAGAGRTAWRSLRRSGLPVLRGLFLALPVVAVLAALLASADPVFNRILQDVLRIFDLERLPEYIFRFIYVMVFTYIFTGVLLFAIFPEPDEPRPDPNQPWKVRFLGSTETGVILGAVVLLFAVFVALQFRYLFGGQANITETGYTYSEYARRGFFELVWVAVLSLGLYIGLGAITRREAPAQERAFTLLSVALMALVLVILVSALNRLLLYEDAYGFTRLRTYTHIFIPWLAALLIAACILQAVRRPGHLGLAALLVLFGFGLTFLALNVDALIARLNLQRARAGQELDAYLLRDLSADAVPTLADAYTDPSTPQAVRARVGAALACLQLEPPRGEGWRSYRPPEARARQALQQVDLRPYLATRGDGTPYVVLDGAEFPCYTGYMD